MYFLKKPIYWSFCSARQKETMINNMDSTINPLLSTETHSCMEKISEHSSSGDIFPSIKIHYIMLIIQINLFLPVVSSPQIYWSL